jgi:PIN domain nuclease of toxin-antitoxin system
MKYVVDTHALIWFLEGNPRLGTSAKTILANPDSQLILPAIALAEAVWIVDRARTSIPSVTDLFDAVNSDPRIVIYPIDKAVIEQSISLSAITEMHDRLIVATALVLKNRGEKIGLLTCDRNITASGLITLIWE